MRRFSARSPRRTPRRRPTPRTTRVLVALALIASVLTVTVVAQQDEALAATAFTPVFSANAPGDITYVSNTLMTCSLTGTNGGRCVGNGQQGSWANNNFTMAYVDVDSDTTTTNSSSNDLVLSGGADVLFAGLFWVGYADDDGVFDETIKIDTPAPGGYTTVTALHHDNLGSRHYGAYTDVTAMVQAGGNGTYTVGGADLDDGASGKYGGWTLAVAYEDNAEPWRNLSIFNGFDFVYRNNTPSYRIDLPVSGFTAPPIGPVAARIGVQTGEGDARYAGPSTAVNTVKIFDAMNPVGNVQNSTISILGSPANTLANPSYSNQLGFDADIIDATGLIPPNATSADLLFRSTGDVYSINLVSTAIDIYVPNLTTNLSKKSVDLNSEQLHPGDVIEYTVQLGNSGDDPATGVVISDLIPTGATYVPNSLRILQDSTSTGPMSDDPGDDNAFFDAGSNTATFYIGDGATPTSGGTVVPLSQGGQTHEVSFQVTVDAETEGDTILNSAAVDFRADFIDEAYTVTTDPTEDEVLPLVDLSIAKTDDVDPVLAGENLVYTLTVDNDGPSTAQNVVVDDSIPAGATLVSAPGCSLAGSTLTCNAGSLPAGDSWSTPVTLTVDGTFTGASITNVARVASDTHEHDGSDNATKEPTEVERQADLGVDKGAPATVAAGESLTYTIEVTNLGESDALNVVLSDPIPTGTTFSSASADLGGICSAAVSCVWPSLAAGTTSTVTIVVDVPSNTADGTAITNKTGVKSDDPDPVGANNTDDASTIVETSADLSVAKAGPATAVAGDQVAYTLDITNNGPSDADNATVSDPVPSSGFTFLSVASSSGCSLSAGTITCAAGTLAPGGSASFTVVFTLDSSIASGTDVTNAITGASDADDPVNANNAAEADTRIIREADLAVRKDDNTTLAIAGGQIAYSLDYRNAGPSDASGVSIADTLPADTTFNAALSSPGCSAVGDAVTCTIGSVADGVSGSVNVVVDVAPGVVDGAALHNEATIDGNETDPLATNDNTEVDTPAERSAELELTKVDDVDPVLAGEDITYTVAVKNIGPSIDDNIVITDTLPSGVAFVTADAGCSHSAGVVACAVGTLAPGASSDFDVTVTTDASLADGTLLTNTARAVGDVSPSIEITEKTTVNTQADVGIAKSGPASVVAGTSMTYTLAVSNDGPSDAANVVVGDALPTGTSYSSHTVTSGTGTCTATASNISCVQTALAADSTFVIDVVVDVDESLADGSTIANTALVRSDTADSSTANNSSDAESDVDRRADVSLAKTAITPLVEAGDGASYQLVVTNNGPSQASGVTVTDVLPAGFVFDAAFSSSGCVSGVTCTVPTELNVGASYVFNVGADVGSGVADGTFTNDASADAAELDPDPDNDDASADVEVTTRADLSVLKLSDQDAFTPGTTHSYTVTVTNNGPSDAQNVSVADVLPAGLSLNTAGTSPGCVTGVSCSTSTLAADDSQSWTIAVDVDSSFTGTITNEVSVDADTADPQPANNDDIDPTPLVPQADLEIAKKADATVLAGDELAYSISLTNNGPSDATNTIVTDALPTGTSFVSASAGCTETSGVVTCGESSLADETTVDYTIIVAVDGDADDGTLLTNEVDVVSDASDPDTTNNGAETETEVEREANLTLSKTASSATAAAGGSMSYSVIVGNEGPSHAASVTVTDALPTGMTATSVSASSGTCFSLGSSIFCSHPDLPGGSSMEITVTVDIDSSVADGTILINDAKTATSTEETNNTDNADSVEVRIGAAADLDLQKTTGVASVIAGEAISYTITVGNSGPSDAQNVVVTDAVPSDLTVTSVDPAADCSVAAALVTCSAGTIADGGTYSVTIDAIVNEAAADTSTLANTATVDSDTDDPDDTNNSGTEETDVEKSADVSVTKAATVAEVSAGETLFYALEVENAGPSSATNVVATDTLPSGVTYNAGLSSSACSPTAGVVTCSFPTLAAGTAVSFVIAVDLPTSLTDETTLVNDVAVVADEDDPVSANNADNDEITTDNQADLSIVKDADGFAVAGESISWSLDIANSGPADALNVVVTDVLPSGASFSSSGSDPRCSAGGSTITCALTALEAGDDDTFVIVVDVASGVADLTALNNTADIDSDTADPDPDDNSSSDSVPVVRNSDLSIVKSDLSDPVVAGGSASWAVEVSNTGPSDADNVTISDTLPAGFSLVSVSNTINCTTAGNTIDCLYPVVAAGDSESITVVADVASSLADGSNHKNTASADGDSAESVSDTEDTTAIRRSDLTISKTSDGTVVAGTNQTYSISISNEGPSDADNVIVTDALPAGLSFVSDTLSACSAIGAVVSCDLGTIGDDATVGFDLVVAVDDTAADPTVNTAIVDSESTDPVSGNNSDADSTDITYAADLSMAKTASPDPAVPGQTITWTLTATNDGPSLANNVTVLDVLPFGTTFVSASTGCTEAAGTVTCSHSALAPGATAGFNITARLDSSLLTSISNTASVSSETPDPDSSNDSDTDSTDLVPSADLSVLKTSSPDPVLAGETLGYLITVTNDGPSDAANIVVTDVLPNELVISSVAPAADCSTTGQTVSCAGGTLAAGATYVVEITATLESSTANGAVVNNTATVTTDTDDPDLSNDLSTEQTDVEKSADLAIEKSTAVTAVAAGESLVYSIEVTNIGPSSATNIVVNDTLPAGVIYNATLSNPSCSETGGAVSCGFAQLNATSSFTFNVAVDLPPSMTDGLTLSNAVGLAADEDDPNLANDADVHEIDLTNQADLSIVKDAEGFAVAGESVSWDLIVHNGGDSDAVNVVVTDPLPTGASFDAADSDSRCTAAAGVVTCALGTVAPGVDDTATIVVDLASSIADLATLSNTATVGSDTEDPDPDDNTSTDGVPVERDSELSIVKADLSDPVIAGGSAQWSIKVANAGPSDANNVTLADSLPAGFDLVSVDDTTNCSTVGDTVNCLFPVIVAGAAETIIVTATVDADLADGSTLLNTATTSSDSSDPVSDTEHTTVVRRSDLEIDKTSDGMVVAGSDHTYTIEVTNNGPSDADNVIVSDALPAGVTFVSDTLSACTAVLGTLSCDLGTIADEGSVSFDLMVFVDDAAGLAATNNVTVQSDSEDPDESNNSARDETVVSFDANLAITKTADLETAIPGQPMSWTITVTNLGPSVANNVVTTDALPTGLTFVNSTGPCSEGTGTVTCTEVAMEADDEVTYTVVAAVDAGFTGDLRNTASTTSDSPDTDLDNNEATAETPTLPTADLSLDKALLTTPVIAGQTVDFLLTLNNAGPSDAGNVEVTDQLPSGMTFVSAPAACSESDGTISCTTPVLEAGATTTFALKVLIESGLAEEARLSNSASVASESDDPDLTNNESDVDMAVTRVSNLVIDKVSLTDDAIAGSGIDYQITVTNEGTSDAANVVVTDALPTGLTFDSTSNSPCLHAAGTVSCSLGTMVAGDSEVITFTAVIDASFAGGTLLQNSAIADSESSEPVTDVDNVTVGASAELAVVKTLLTENPSIGDELVWEIVVSNSGPSAAVNVAIEDLVGPDYADVSVESLLEPSTCDVATVGANTGANVGANNVSCTAPSVPVGVTWSTRITGTATNDAAGAQTNAITVTSETGEAVSASVDFSVGTPNVEITLAKEAGNTVSRNGDSVLWTITVTNSGDPTATPVVVSDTITSSQELVTASSEAAACSTMDATVTCTLAPGFAGSAEIAVTTRILDVSGTIGNEATLTLANGITNVSRQADDVAGTTSGVLAFTGGSGFALIFIGSLSLFVGGAMVSRSNRSRRKAA